MAAPRGRIVVGTSGFSYAEWRGIFYPTDLPPKGYLAYYAQHFPTTEINNTFYRIPSAKVTAGWYEQTPAQFSFTLKLSQRITHEKRLREVADEMGWFLSGASGLREKLGPILVQLPPNFRKDVGLLGDFLARYAAQRMLAFEFRHDSWFADDTFDLLRRHAAALGVVEADERAAQRAVTGTFVYMRLRKTHYEEGELRAWGEWMGQQTVDVYCYLKHDDLAPVLAKKLLAMLDSEGSRVAGSGAAPSAPGA
ncbi:MAG: DUF72 domain-containing protein [Chloroflexi bacterium]|nr:DUF72 domain-containing protein [Chloroflexota bacterium]